jgi:pimeloyl-ACP methyl ester carboxylesterase
VLVLEGSGERVLVFLPGFLSAAASYRALLEPVAAAGATVVVPQLYPRGIAALAGRVPVSAEAAAAADLVRATVDERGTRSVFLAGHSRGGQAAWRAAGLLAAEGLPAGLVLLDPVDGEGRRPTAPAATATPAAFSCPALVIGAGLGGRCAPGPVNHRAFAEATPHARHVVVRGFGHADLLQGRARSLGRRLCGGAADPDPGRAACSALLAAFLEGDPAGASVSPDLVEWLAR